MLLLPIKIILEHFSFKMTIRLEHSFEVRTKIVWYYQEGLSLGKIAKNLKISKGNVLGIVRRWKTRRNVVYRKGRGRKLKTTAPEDAASLRKARINPLLSAQKISTKLQKEFGVTLHTCPIKRKLKSAGFREKSQKRSHS